MALSGCDKLCIAFTVNDTHTRARLTHCMAQNRIGLRIARNQGSVGEREQRVIPSPASTLKTNFRDFIWKT